MIAAVKCSLHNGASDGKWCFGCLLLFPIYMKKNRPAYMLTVLCRPEDRERLEDIIFEETTTIGIRRALMQRTILQRRKSTEQTSLGDVAVKTMKKKNGEVPTLEYESVAAIARAASAISGSIPPSGKRIVLDLR
ncbi:MAG: nickel insertion protein [Eubacterium ramulus]